jgi:hypothetical protein
MVLAQLLSAGAPFRRAGLYMAQLRALSAAATTKLYVSDLSVE